MTQDQQSTTVGVIGLGVMGGRAAATLVSAGHDVTGFDVLAAACDRARSTGVRIAADAGDVARNADLVLLSLPGPADTLQVSDAIAEETTSVLVADLSTIDPASARQAGARLRGGGHRYVDSPVLGRPAGVGGWTLPVGGAEADVAQLRTLVVGTIAKAVQHVGDVGTGSAVKVLNNAMFGVINAVTAQVLDLAGRVGLDPARFVEVVADSGAATVSPLFRDVAPRMVAGDHTVAFSLDLLRKDLGLAVALAHDYDVDGELVAVAERLTQSAVEAGHGAQDTSAVIELFRTRRAVR